MCLSCIYFGICIGDVEFVVKELLLEVVRVSEIFWDFLLFLFVFWLVNFLWELKVVRRNVYMDSIDMKLGDWKCLE